MKYLLNRLIYVLLITMSVNNLCLAQNMETGTVQNNGNSYTITMTDPGTILNYLPATRIKEIDSLTVVGLMDERDFKYINHMEKLKYLDLTSAYVTYEPSRKQAVQNSKEAQAAIATYLGEALEAKKNAGEMDELRYEYNKFLAELMKKSASINVNTDPCFLPAIINLPLLETVKMPQLAEWLESKCFRNCTSLKNVEWSENIRKIKSGCFVNTAIEFVIFPKELREISFDTYGGAEFKEPFTNCKNIKAFSFKKCNNLGKIDLYRLIRDKPNLTEVFLAPSWKNAVWVYSRGNTVSYIFPEKVNKITVEASDYDPMPQLWFLSPTPPDVLMMNKREMYVIIPKGSLDAYYGAIGLDNDKIKFLEYTVEDGQYKIIY